VGDAERRERNRKKRIGEYREDRGRRDTETEARRRTQYAPTKHRALGGDSGPAEFGPYSPVVDVLFPKLAEQVAIISVGRNDICRFVVHGVLM
jgi:hypothetical protein